MCTCPSDLIFSSLRSTHKQGAWQDKKIQASWSLICVGCFYYLVKPGVPACRNGVAGLECKLLVMASKSWFMEIKNKKCKSLTKYKC